MSRLVFKFPIYGVLLVCLLWGSYLRLSHLEQKTFWYDETYTAIPISGQTKRDVKEDWIRHFDETGEVFQVADLDRYQRPQPGTNWFDAIASLGAEEAHNSPLYFAIARPVVSLMGLSPVISMRGLAVAFGLLSLWGIFLLSQELFASPLVSCLAVALMAASPFHILYAQEARQYSLFTAIAVFSSVFLLRALQSNEQADWRKYCVSLIAGLYTQPLFILCHLAHGIYIFLIPKSISKSIFQTFLKTTRWAYAAFLPWLIVIVLSLGSIANWRKKTLLSFPSLVGRWIINVGRTFYDFPLPGPNQYDFPALQSGSAPVVWLLIFSLILYAFWRLFATARKREWLFVILLAAVPALPFILADLLLGGVRSVIPRYFVACYVAIILAVAYCLAERIQSSRSLSRVLWQGGAIALLLVGLITSTQAVRAETWWHKYSNYYDDQTAHILHAATDPVLVGDEATRLIALSYRLRPDIPIQLMDVDRIKELPPNADLFFYGTSELREGLEEQKGYCSSIQYEHPLYYTSRTVQLWQLTPCIE